jgi:outer membrane protein
MYLKHGHAESGKNAGDFIGNFIATLFAVVLLFGAAAHAQPAATDGSGLPIVTGSLSLADAVSLGLADNLPLRGARADFDAAAAESRSAGAQTLPGISTTTFATAGDSSNIVGSAPNVSPQSLMSVSPHGSIAQTITLMAPIFTGGVLANRLRAAVLMSDAAKQDEQSSVLAITRSITDAYADAVYKQALVEVAASRLADEREQVRITQQSVDTGKSAPIDLLREQAELANANQMKTQADSDAALAILTLKSVLGISLLSDVTPTDSLDRLAQTAAGRDAPETQGDAIRLAEADRPEMDAAARPWEPPGASMRHKFTRSRWPPTRPATASRLGPATPSVSPRAYRSMTEDSAGRMSTQLKQECAEPKRTP